MSKKVRQVGIVEVNRLALPIAATPHCAQPGERILDRIGGDAVMFAH